MRCINCGEEITRTHVWQGIQICSNCFKIVSHTIAKTKKEMQQVFLLYTDMIRVALIKGELRPPVLPDTKTMPPDIFKDALKKAIDRVGVKHGKETKPSNSNSAMPKVPDGTHRGDADGV